MPYLIDIIKLNMYSRTIKVDSKIEATYLFLKDEFIPYIVDKFNKDSLEQLEKLLPNKLNHILERLQEIIDIPISLKQNIRENSFPKFKTLEEFLDKKTYYIAKFIHHFSKKLSEEQVAQLSNLTKELINRKRAGDNIIEESEEKKELLNIVQQFYSFLGLTEFSNAISDKTVVDYNKFGNEYSSFCGLEIEDIEKISFDKFIELFLKKLLIKIFGDSIGGKVLKRLKSLKKAKFYLTYLKI